MNLGHFSFLKLHTVLFIPYTTFSLSLKNISFFFFQLIFCLKGQLDFSCLFACIHWLADDKILLPTSAAWQGRTTRLLCTSTVWVWRGKKKRKQQLLQGHRIMALWEGYLLPSCAEWGQFGHQTLWRRVSLRALISQSKVWRSENGKRRRSILRYEWTTSESPLPTAGQEKLQFWQRESSFPSLWGSSGQPWCLCVHSQPQEHAGSSPRAAYQPGSHEKMIKANIITPACLMAG